MFLKFRLIVLLNDMSRNTETNKFVMLEVLKEILLVKLHSMTMD